jgi:hypothetical protein
MAMTSSFFMWNQSAFRAPGADTPSSGWVPWPSSHASRSKK